jgi:hypothetical protein
MVFHVLHGGDGKILETQAHIALFNSTTATSSSLSMNC